jgi:hypothetical protein
MPQRQHVDLSKLRSEQEEEDQITGLVRGTTAPEGQVPALRATRVVAIPLSQVLPDRFQTRVILPPELKRAFFAGEVDCFDTARSLLQAAQADPALRRQVDELLLLGESILTDRQIEPATGSWVKTRQGSRFLLETGERRFWALALQAVAQALGEEPRLKVTEEAEINRFRQVAENLLREDISAVDLGKAIAALILLQLGKQPDPDMNELAYYRQALAIKKLPAGLWLEVHRVIGLSRPVLYRHLQLLRLDDELLYLASLYRLEEGRLRQIVTAPASQQRNLVLAAIQEPHLTGEDLGGIAQAGETSPEGYSETLQRARARKGPRPPLGPHRQLAVRVKSMLNLLGHPDFDGDLDEVASELSGLYRNPESLESAAEYLEALAASLRKIRARRR